MFFIAISCQHCNLIEVPSSAINMHNRNSEKRWIPQKIWYQPQCCVADDITNIGVFVCLFLQEGLSVLSLVRPSVSPSVWPISLYFFVVVFSIVFFSCFLLFILFFFWLFKFGYQLHLHLNGSTTLLTDMSTSILSSTLSFCRQTDS